MEVTKTLAQFVIDSQYGDIAKPVKHEAVRSVLNWLGCAVGGSHHETIDIAFASARAVFRTGAGFGSRAQRTARYHACCAHQRHQLACLRFRRHASAKP